MRLIRALLVSLVILLVAEGALRATFAIRNSRVDAIPLPYMAHDNYGPMPPWIDGVRILEPDDTLLWHTRPNQHRKYIDVFSPVWTNEDREELLRQFRPAVPESLRGNPVWEISINSEGFRDSEFREKASAAGLRILSLGDSWTFGANVGQTEAYPQLLESLLQREFPSAGIRVFNLGVLGYSSFQGLELLRRRALALNPNVITIAYAMNDSAVPGYRDKDAGSELRKARPLVVLARAADQVQTIKLLLYWGRMAASKLYDMGDMLKWTAENAGKPEEAWWAGQAFEEVDYERIEPLTRVSPRDYEANLLEMIRLARGRGAAVILLYNQLWVTPYRQVLERISREQGVPLVDSQALIAAAARKEEQELEAKLNLRPAAGVGAAASGEIEVVFRVYCEKLCATNGLYIAGTHPQLGDRVPNKIALHDDGTRGDQRAGDHVYSYAARFAPGTALFYVYTNGGRPGRWEGLDVPHIRNFKVPSEASGRLYQPIETFGRIYMRADGWHTNARGHTLIARALLETLRREPALQRLQQPAGGL